MIGKNVKGQHGKSFRVVEEIGRGGFGVVYRVEDNRKQSYAMKLIRGVDDPQMRVSFESEVANAHEISSKNVVRVVDYGECEVGRGETAVFAIMEYCPEGDYRRVLERYCKEGTDVAHVLEDFSQILSGLEAVHEKVLHRDLKPANILVKKGRLKITDFGLSKLVDESTRTSSFKGGGTPLYMAPEVWSMHRASRATDLYAVGIMLFEAVAGAPPFTGEDVNELRELHLYTPAPRLRSTNADVPGHIDGLVKRLLDKDPKRRYQSAREVREVLASGTSDSPPDVGDLVEGIRRAHDKEESASLEQERLRMVEEDERARDRYMEKQLVALVDEVVEEVNRNLQETQIVRSGGSGEIAYRLGNRSLHIHFFRSNELFENPSIPGRIEELRKYHPVHGGFIEIREGGQDREGWNVVLVRPPDDMYGEWKVIETRVSALTGKRLKYEPAATQAQLLADNLSCHWGHAMHVYQLKDEPLTREKILEILRVLIPK